MGMNVFRILGDVSHILSKCILMWSIHSNQSAEGVSLITQAFYAAVFCTRYIDMFNFVNMWNFVIMIFYIVSSFYIIFLMMRVYARTRERENAWKMGAWILGGSVVSAPIIMLIFQRKAAWGFMETLWTFSIILESVCVLPQLLLLRQTNVPTVIDSFYLLTLGSYRGFYILNWIYRALDVNNRKPDAISIIFGVVQTALYLDFAWVYWTRQRVKLRSGGVVDADDFGKSWFLNKILGRHVEVAGEDEESRPALDGSDDIGGGRPGPQRTASTGWGRRGISVSADDGVLAEERSRQDEEEGLADTDPDAKMQDPDELARVLEDEEDHDGALPTRTEDASARVGNGQEWRDSAE